MAHNQGKNQAGDYIGSLASSSGSPSSAGPPKTDRLSTGPSRLEVPLGWPAPMAAPKKHLGHQKGWALYPSCNSQSLGCPRCTHGDPWGESLGCLLVHGPIPLGGGRDTVSLTPTPMVSPAEAGMMSASTMISEPRALQVQTCLPHPSRINLETEGPLPQANATCVPATGPM